jgi:hypothetical protein
MAIRVVGDMPPFRGHMPQMPSSFVVLWKNWRWRVFMLGKGNLDSGSRGERPLSSGHEVLLVAFLICLCSRSERMKVFGKLWRDADGFVVSSELVLIATVVVIGLLTGLASVRDAVISELSDVAGAIQDINESYSIDGVVGHNANTAGFNYLDGTDECDLNDDPAGVADNCITFNGVITNEESVFTRSVNLPST